MAKAVTDSADDDLGYVRQQLEKIQFDETLAAEFRLGRDIAQALQERGAAAYIAGGFPRDLLLAVRPKDVDLATSAQPETVMGLALPDVEFDYVAAAEAYPVVIAQRDGVAIEVATFRKDAYDGASEGRRPTAIDTVATLAEDAARRDLTVNALYFDPVTEEIHDPTGQGLADNEQGIIRVVGVAAERFQEDRLRIVRTVRLKNQLGFSYAPETEAALAALGSEARHIRAHDRIRTELAAMLVHASRADGVRDLDRFGILDCLVPEFSEGKGVEQPLEFHSEGDVFAHQLLVLENLPDDCDETLAWAAFLHDIGKPHTKSVDENGRVRFNGHDAVGASLAKRVLQRLRAAKSQTAAVEWLVANHMAARNVVTMRRSKQVRLVYPQRYDARLKRDDLADLLLALVQADSAASLRPDGSVDTETPALLKDVIETVKAEAADQAHTVKQGLGIDGLTLIEYLAIGDADVHHLDDLIAYLDEVYEDQPGMGYDEALDLASAWFSGVLSN